MVAHGVFKIGCCAGGASDAVGVTWLKIRAPVRQLPGPPLQCRTLPVVGQLQLQQTWCMRVRGEGGTPRQHLLLFFVDWCHRNSLF